MQKLISTLVLCFAILHSIMHCGTGASIPVEPRRNEALIRGNSASELYRELVIYNIDQTWAAFLSYGCVSEDALESKLLNIFRSIPTCILQPILNKTYDEILAGAINIKHKDIRKITKSISLENDNDVTLLHITTEKIGLKLYASCYKSWPMLTFRKDMAA